jgi:hypothetical protein
MKVRSLFLIAVTIVVSATSILPAQDRGGRRGDRDRDRDRDRGGERDEGGRGAGGGRGFGGGPGGMMGMMGGGMMGGMMGGGASQLLGLLRMGEVREEIGLSDEEYESIQSAQRESWGRMSGLREASEEERKEIMEEMNTAAQDLLDEVLPPAKQKRLLGLLVQQVGAPAVLNQIVAKEIGLSESTSGEIRTELESFGQKLREQFAGMREAGGPPNFAQIQEQMGKIRDELNETIESKLTDEQKNLLESLKGEKFDFPEGGMFGMGRGPGGREGLRGQGPRGERGGEEGSRGGGRSRRGGDRD